MLRMSRCPGIALSLCVIVALAAAPAAAMDKTSGSRNFTPPASVPNYFSNESGPMLGGRADSRVVDPPNVSAVVPPPPQSLRAATVSPAATSPRMPSSRSAKGHGRVRQASAHHGRSSRQHVVGAHGKARTHVASARSAHAAPKSPKRRAS
jgi:hypothetical protein